MTRLCAHAQGCTRPVMRMVWSSDAQDPYTMYKRCVCTPPHAGVGSRAGSWRTTTTHPARLSGTNLAQGRAKSRFAR